MDWELEGYEDLEISAQIVIREALKRGLEVEVLDRSESFIRIKKESHVEYIKEGSQTAIDSFMTYLIMENKAITKLVLKEKNICVPHGETYDDPSEAYKAYLIFNHQKIVVKPKKTNFGIGITIIESGTTEAVYRSAIDRAFSHGQSILIEEFIEGLEYRVLVIGGKVIGVTHRIPANVVGDGDSSIRQLIEKKNLDPRRGKDYSSPLIKIELGEVESNVLAEQGLNFDSIPAKNQQIFLRHNSNMSTGGDTVDYTLTMHEGYRKIAIRAAQAVNAKICGVDMMIRDIISAPTNGNYAIVELNFNPILSIHNFPYEGENRNVGKAIIDLLGF